jgi:hypothetical protein
MELDKILQKLYNERIKLDEIIASLERLRKSAAVAEKPGRKQPKTARRKAKKRRPAKPKRA